MSMWLELLYERLQTSLDAELAGIAAKSLKEARYHRQHSSDWVVRLGDGTEESKARMQAALNVLWPYFNELFAADGVDGVGPAWNELAPEWLRIGGYWYPRGGIPIDVFWQTGPAPQGLWLPDQGVAPYRGRG